MAYRLEKHPRYWVGQEHSMFFRSLQQSLREGPEDFARYTDRRRAWIEDRYHYFPELMLVGCFAYLEGELEEGWIGKYGGKLKRELYVLRLVRNAVVHTAGNLSKLDGYKGRQLNARRGRPPDITAYVRRFVRDLRAGRVTDPKGKTVPEYMSVSRSGVAALNKDAFRRVYILSIELMRCAGRLPSKPDGRSGSEADIGGLSYRSNTNALYEYSP